MKSQNNYVSVTTIVRYEDSLLKAASLSLYASQNNHQSKGLCVDKESLFKKLTLP